jgi:hypothetical protein
MNQEIRSKIFQYQYGDYLYQLSLLAAFHGR